MEKEREFPEGMVPLGKEPFTFNCHPGVSCFTKCCQKVDMFLFPYDILCLKNALSMDSYDFLQNHTRLVQGDNPYFPAVMLKLNEQDNCPFLEESGCAVYRQRPSACRTYPLERAIDRAGGSSRRDFYFLTHHDYCMGHQEEKTFSVKQWIRNQQLDKFNLMNDLWGELDTLFSTNPWRGEGAGGEKQRLAFMVCYDIDGFRRFAEKNQLIEKFRLTKDDRKRIQKDDTELLKFGFEWLKLILTGKSSLVQR
ncbi:MAG: YkgJ family cysteine cluster protein [Desulfocapsaceae bacterium]|nr:YkgJ family cysteine cluster protein [Desulfocapsaceae bacterium]